MSRPFAAISSKSQLGLWLYLMTDLMLFASLFATYLVLKPNIAGGVNSTELYNLPYALVQTILLLISSMTSGMAYVAYRYHKKKLAGWLMIGTIVLGMSFLTMEIYEFAEFVHEGYSWQTSAFLSGFFALVGTHGAHILIGLLWATATLILIMKSPVSDFVSKKLAMFTIFWHFLELVWIWIFTVVYLLGSIT